MDGFKVISAFHPFDIDVMSTKNFWEKGKCLLVVALYSLEAVAPNPQKGTIKFMIYIYIYIYIYKVFKKVKNIYIYIYIYYI